MKNKKGFTLIELLAVIVILAIIALIAVPVIMNVLNKANKSAFKDTAYGILSAGELYFAEQQLELNGMSDDAEFTWPNNLGTLQVKGNVPNGTVLKVNTKGETAIAMSNGRYCITKGYSDRDITITEEFTECNIPDGEETVAKTLSDLAVVSQELGVNNIESCVEKGQVCDIDADGTAFAIKVNNGKTYKFYVLSDDGNTVNLIMASNLYAEGNTTEPNVAWSSKEEGCEISGLDRDGDGVFDETWCNNAGGPVMALRTLKTRTSDWTNIAKYSYTLNDVNNIYTYSGEYVQNVKARLPMLSDFINNVPGCTQNGMTCPAWVTEGLVSHGDDNTSGYWLSDASGNTSAYVAFMFGDFRSNDIVTTTSYGVRPVITLTK